VHIFANLLAYSLTKFGIDISITTICKYCINSKRFEKVISKHH